MQLTNYKNYQVFIYVFIIIIEGLVCERNYFDVVDNKEAIERYWF